MGSIFRTSALRVLCCAGLGCAAVPALAQDDGSVAGGWIGAQEEIVGTWVGQATQADNSFETRLTFVSPKGGVSRYPGFPCGGMLSGDRKGDAYVFTEAITWGGMTEKKDGCIDGTIRVTIDGDTMQYEWSGTHAGQDYAASGQLHRLKGRPVAKK